MMDMETLIHRATTARSNAYAPYSGFAVGAAILDEQGGVHIGCNVENAAYPQSQCAEATAIGSMIASGSADTSILITAGGKIIAEHTLADLLPESFGPENLG